MNTNQDTKAVIRKWYVRLSFPERFDREFYQALDTIAIPEGLTLADCDLNSQDGKWNLLAFLYLCEALEEWYREKGISEEILLDTLLDIVRWTQRWSEVKGELFLGELPWLSRHFEKRLYKLGRLQFCMAPSRWDIPQYGVKKGDHILEIHIPAAGKLTPEGVRDSLAQAEKFFPEHFPEFSYKCMTCSSWLLDAQLEAYLPQSSNILQFASLFDRLGGVENNAVIRFLFRWDTTEENLSSRVPTTEFTRQIREAVLEGKKFQETLGVRVR